MRNKRIVESFESFMKDNLEYLMMYKKTYIKKSERENRDSNIIIDEVKNYDVSKFRMVNKTYGIFIYPDEYFIELCRKLDDSVSDDLFFYITVSTINNNQIDFTEGIPDIIRGLSIGYKLYKLVINKFGWVTSDRYSSQHAYNLWYNLLQDIDLYCFTSNMMSGLISKIISDDDLKSVIDRFKDIKDIEFDDELMNKLKELENDGI